MNKLSYEDIQNRIDLKHGNGEYTLGEGSYSSYSKKIIAIHRCGYKWSVQPDSIINKGTTCPKCSGRLRFRWDQESFSRRIEEMSNGEYCLDSDFQSVKKIVDIKHIECGRVRTVLGQSALKGGYTCEMCNIKKGRAIISTGEKKILEYLELNGVSYSFQHREDECKYKRVLPFDFALLDSQGNPWAMIEFDGEQHFNRDGFYDFSDSYTSDYDLELQQIKDNIKDGYCVERGIIMLRIPYTNISRIDSILQRFLRVHKKS